MKKYKVCGCGGKIVFKMTDTINISGYVDENLEEIDVELGDRGENQPVGYSVIGEYFYSCEDCFKDYKSSELEELKEKEEKDDNKY